MPEIVPIVSESLEAKVRDLLPSQRGFGEDLQASNIILPIIDLTASAEGATVPEYQAQAFAFGSNTAYNVTNTSTTLTSTAGFWRIVGVVTAEANITGSNPGGSVNISDGLATKSVWAAEWFPINGTLLNQAWFDLIIFLRSGDSLIAQANDASSIIKGSYRQVADVNGTAINPSGFTPQ